MKKAKKTTPSVGNRVSLRGRGSIGVLKSCNDLNWCRVSWDSTGPKLCHLLELDFVVHSDNPADPHRDAISVPS